MHILKDKKNIYFIFFALVILFVHQAIFSTYLDTGKYHFDHQSALSRLIFGKIWFLKNGLSIPWFTPHICCGAPYYANPQSDFYSPIQLLFILFKPLTSIKLVFFLFSSSAFFGMFMLLKKIFKLSNSASLIGSTLFLFNHYFNFHYLSGHYGYGLFALIPLFFYVSSISINQSNHKNTYFYIICSALIFAMIMHSGGSRIIVEILISIFFLSLIHLIKFKDLKIILYIGLSVFIGLLISSSKIYAAWTFVENVSREVDPIYFKSIRGFISTFFNFFFLIPKEDISDILGSQLINLSIEEFSFNISILPIIILILYIRGLPKLTNDKFKLFFSMVLLLSAFILILLNFSNTTLGSIVRNIPFITNDWISFRMLAPFVILFSVITAYMFEALKFKKIYLVSTLFISIIIIQNLLFDRNKLHEVFAHTAFKKMFNINITSKNVDDYKIQEIISILNAKAEYDGPKQHDFFLNNQSMQMCYFSIFGYDLEKLRPRVKDLIFNKREQKLVDKNILTSKKIGSKIYLYTGDPLIEKNNSLNFINPACYLNPKGNDCDNNFLFKSYQKKDLINFLNYKPFEFKQTKAQIFFNYLSIIIFLFSILYLIFFSSIKIWLKKNPPGN